MRGSKARHADVFVLLDTKRTCRTVSNLPCGHGFCAVTHSDNYLRRALSKEAHFTAARWVIFYAPIVGWLIYLDTPYGMQACNASAAAFDIIQYFSVCWKKMAALCKFVCHPPALRVVKA